MPIAHLVNGQRCSQEKHSTAESAEFGTTSRLYPPKRRGGQPSHRRRPSPTHLKVPGFGWCGVEFAAAPVDVVAAGARAALFGQVDEPVLQITNDAAQVGRVVTHFGHTTPGSHSTRSGAHGVHPRLATL
jgi:hypothetical protein